MGCGCGSGGCSNGGCGKKGGCSSAGCNRLNVYDWLENMLPPGSSEKDNIYEVKFKTTRKSFFRNANAIDIVTGDYVVVESDRGFDIGVVTMGGELVRLQMKKKKIDPESVQRIFRVATEEDMLKLEENRNREMPALSKTREIITNLQLNMKLTDIEYQADGTKAIFYYTAEQRVDFRELIKILAEDFKLRVEMRQIGQRQEAGLVGGIGACGRELCCSSWLTEFENVSTASARYQNLSLNPMKITGLCGRLKCCLNFELETYLDALKDIPKINQIETELGIAHLQKTDIFKRMMWFSYPEDESWTGLPVEKVIEMVRMNKNGQKPATLHEHEIQTPGSKNRGPKDNKNKNIDFVDVVGQSNLHLEKDKKNNNNNKHKHKKKPNQNQQNNLNNNPNNTHNNNNPNQNNKLKK